MGVKKKDTQVSKDWPGLVVMVMVLVNDDDDFFVFYFLGLFVQRYQERDERDIDMTGRRAGWLAG